MQTNTITYEQVVDLVITLPPERLMSVYDFALFVKEHPLSPTLEVDIFDESEDQIRADEERWNQQFEASRETLRAIAHEVAKEFRTGQTNPMHFTTEGRLAR